MDKLRVTDLEIGKAYKASNGSLYKISETHYNDELELLVKANKESEWRKSSLSAIGLMRMKFEGAKKEIDWANVPKFTPVIGGYSGKKLKNAYFLDFYEAEDDFPFLLTDMKDDEFTGLKHRYQNEFVCDVCRIHPSVEIKEEWYK